jgi:hypothetical protein
METWIRRFDAASQDRDTVSAAFDFFPLEDLNFGWPSAGATKNTGQRSWGCGKARRKDSISDVLVPRLQNRSAVRLLRLRAGEAVPVPEAAALLNATSGFDPSLPRRRRHSTGMLPENRPKLRLSARRGHHPRPGKWTLQLCHSYIKSDGSVDYTYLLGSNPLPAGRNAGQYRHRQLGRLQPALLLVKLVYDATKNWSILRGVRPRKIRLRGRPVRRLPVRAGPRRERTEPIYRRIPGLRPTGRDIVFFRGHLQILDMPRRKPGYKSRPPARENLESRRRLS